MSNARHYPVPSRPSPQQVRSGTEYYKNWDKFAATLEEDAGEEAHVAAQAAKAAANTAARGPEHTAKLIEMNADLSPGERAWHAEQERLKGNECFR